MSGGLTCDALKSVLTSALKTSCGYGTAYTLPLIPLTYDKNWKWNWQCGSGRIFLSGNLLT